MSKSEFELVVEVGKKYKVRLKPKDELIALGLLDSWDEDCTWYKDYLCGDVGWVTLPRQEEWNSVRVHWSDGESFFYRLRELKVLGEV